ncbi:GAF domain-containing protein [Halobacillus mangrovi]|uniref:GAF domain-containing protein n=1 Tax=Halobacillus mangrovi TaxID=402384 RepID=UPI003D967DB2
MNETIGDVCKELQRATGASFIAIAEWDGATRKIKWTYALDPLNDKYTRMEISYGYGVAGKVMQTGRPFACKHPSQLPDEITKYPIILAEKLQSFLAVPLLNTKIFDSVLLIGYREIHPLPDKQLLQEHLTHVISQLKRKEALS